ncbi:hypothetical protein [Kitasatospora sp. HPMI-4]|uniref:hypothetical protein n=1 Tax=Kitasatospora sp. HPMI-4 TaxID=3448443 RepID=UPI003F1D40DE
MSTNDGIEVVRKDFRVSVGGSPLRMVVESAGLRQEFIPEIAIDTAGGIDRAVLAEAPERVEHTDFERITWTARSTGWGTKRYSVDVFAAHLVFSVTAQGSGSIDSVRYFDTIAADGFGEHFALTKHFNDRGRTPARAYSTGSPAAFTHVLCPEPNTYARQLTAPHEYAQVSVNADLDHGGGNFMANPGLLAFAVNAAGQEQWWAIGLAVKPGGHLFSELEYLGGPEGFALGLNCWGAAPAVGTYEPPGIILVPGVGATAALTAYVHALLNAGLVARPARRPASWWARPIVCGWGHQSWQGDLFRIRSTRERGPDTAVYTLCTETNYRDIVTRLEAESLPFGTVVVDARWFLAGGLKNIDTGRWPDLPGFVAEQHHAGRKVLLWWGPWDTEGIDAEECVRWWPDRQLHTNRPGRLSKFGTPAAGAKLGIDITLPTVRERIRSQVHQLLGAGPGCANADGLKLDHQSAVPGIYGMAFPVDSDRLFGIEAAFEMQRVIYEAAKEAKPDALIVGQSPNPYFSGVQDMVRLGDIYSHRAESVLPEMTFRAEMARVADPTALIDTDGWPLPSLAAWREYTAAQPSLGVPSLYYASHLDTTGEALTADDFALLRRTWRTL